MPLLEIKAPTRVDLAGGTLDLWPLYALLGSGKTINVAIDLFATVTFEEVQKTGPFNLNIQVGEVGQYDLSRPLSLEEVRKLDRIHQFPVMVASQFLSKVPLPKKQFSMKLTTQAPIGSGLGGSTSLCVAMAVGLTEIFKASAREKEWEWRLLDWVKDVEAAYLELPTGTQDALAAIFGGLHCYESGVGKIHKFDYQATAFKALSDRLLVLFSGEQHHSGLSNWEIYKAAMDRNKAVLGGFFKIQSISDSMDKALRADSIDWAAIGQLMTEEWETRRTTFQVETERLNEITGFLKREGALGAKVCGAAQGGSLIALVDPLQKETLRKKCQDFGIDVLTTSPTDVGVTQPN